MLDVTVITPTIPERKDVLAECINSVKGQTVAPAAHYIGLDASRKGPSTVRNELIEKTKTKWLCFLDDDDILYPNHFEVLYENIMGQDKYDLIWTWCDTVGRENFNPNSRFDANRLRQGNYIPITVLVKTDLVKEVGCFDTEARLEDWDLWIKLLNNGAVFHNIPIITWQYRFVGNNRTFLDEH